MTRRKKGTSPSDPMLVGYFMHDKSKTPYDYLTDPETGIRPNAGGIPQGFVKVDLTRGIDGVVLPPLAIWNRGEWALAMEGPEKKALAGARLSYDDWVVPGEGTPGNYEWRVYTLPSSISALENPKHPGLWLHHQKKGWSNWSGQKTGTATPTKTGSYSDYSQGATLPAGIRFRCPGCGHWWKESTLAPHSTSCCPGLNGGTSDWAILCECCLTLDEVATCKPGFPRKPNVVEKEVSQEPEPEPAEATTSV